MMFLTSPPRTNQSWSSLLASSITFDVLADEHVGRVERLAGLLEIWYGISLRLLDHPSQTHASRRHRAFLNVVSNRLRVGVM